MENKIEEDDDRIKSLYGGNRLWWDVDEQQMVLAVTLYVAFGCPDWGEKGGKRNNLCTFCALPNAAQKYRETFYSGLHIPDAEHVKVFNVNLSTAPLVKDAHTLMIFNAGSFLAMPESVQQEIMHDVVSQKNIKRVVIESRATLITEEAIKPLMEILSPAGKLLSVRIGVETNNDHLRLKVLRKGHSRKELHRAVAVLKKYGVTAGGYALLKPAPNSDLWQIIDIPRANEDEVNQWAVGETKKTLDWILGDGEGQLGMDEAYLCSTNVGPGTLLTTEWKKGNFSPASLWMVYAVLINAVQKYGPRVHLLPFKDEPPFLAISSNHVSKGIPENLDGAQGCDKVFHAMFDRYRESMDPSVLKPPSCSCRPKWL